MSQFALELLDSSHDRPGFQSGLESIDRYLWETARGHTEKGVALTRVLVESESVPPKPILGYFTLAPCMVEATEWMGAPRRLPRNPVGAILLGRLGVASRWQGQQIGARLIALARMISADSLRATGGIGLVVDAATIELVSFYEKFGFRRISADSLRLFLPTPSLVEAADS